MYWVTGILGILLIIAPFVAGYTNDPAALWSNIIIGAIVVIVSAIEGGVRDRARWEYWFAAFMGLLAILAPFALHFTVPLAAFWISLILGFVIAVLAGYKAITMNRHNEQQTQ
jgi:uncharacterized membrane protein HdeD (DUF308 family)